MTLRKLTVIPVIPVIPEMTVSLELSIGGEGRTIAEWLAHVNGFVIAEFKDPGLWIGQSVVATDPVVRPESVPT